jgi:hypothetical protein
MTAAVLRRTCPRVANGYGACGNAERSYVRALQLTAGALPPCSREHGEMEKGGAVMRQSGVGVVIRGGFGANPRKRVACRALSRVSWDIINYLDIDLEWPPPTATTKNIERRSKATADPDCKKTPGHASCRPCPRGTQAAGHSRPEEEAIRRNLVPAARIFA